MTELEEMEQRADESLQRLPAMKRWAIKQSADLRAKAEVMEQVDEEVEVYGETDPERLREVSEKIERIENAFQHGI